MAYLNLVETLQRKLLARLDQITVVHNFEFGQEFEVALCQVLREILPTQYGICRGYAVTADDVVAGDDILIFDQVAFPTIRALKRDDFGTKEHVPIEAVYCYIEAKHTLQVKGSKRNAEKAIQQVSAVKRLTRRRREMSQIFDRHTGPVQGFQFRRPQWPTFLNPIYGVVFARHCSEGDTAVIRQELGGCEWDRAYGPDLLVAGDLLGLPCLQQSPENVSYASPFVCAEIENSSLLFRSFPGRALGMAICSLLYALDTIRLGPIDWRRVFQDELTR